MTISIDERLSDLKLRFISEHYQDFAAEAAASSLSHVGFLSQLIEGEFCAKQDRSVSRRIKLARFPFIKTLDQFQWSWPKDINRLQIQNLFELQFLQNHSNVVFLGTVGVGKTHLSIALGYAACLKQHTVLFASAIDVVNRSSPGSVDTYLRWDS